MLSAEWHGANGTNGANGANEIEHWEKWENSLRKLIYFLIVLLLIGGGAYYYFSTHQAPEEKPYVVEPRVIYRSVHGWGLVEGSSVTMHMKFPWAGQAEEINAKEGQVVKQGEIIAKLNTTEIDFKIKLEESTLKEVTAKRDAINARKNSGEVANIGTQVKAELENVRIASEYLKKIQNPTYQTERQDKMDAAARAVDRARRNLALVEAELKLLKSRPTQHELAVATARLDAAKLRSEDARRTGAGTEAAAAELTYALANYDLVKRGATEEDVNAATLRIALAKTDLEQAEEEKKRLDTPRPPPTAPLAAIAEAEKELASAKEGLETKRKELEKKQKEAQEADFLEAQAKVEGSNEKLKMLKNMKLGYELRAPFDALVTKRLAEADTLLAPYEDVLWLVDFAHKRVRAEFDVLALPSLSEGQKAKIKSRAFGKEELSAKVLSIRNAHTRSVYGDDPNTSRGGEVIEVMLEIEKPEEPAKKEIYDKILRPGLRAEADIILESTNKPVICVPKSYIASDKDAQYVMKTEVNPRTQKLEKPRRQEVKIGMRDEYYVEIKDDALHAEDMLVKPKAQGK